MHRESKECEGEAAAVTCHRKNRGPRRESSSCPLLTPQKHQRTHHITITACVCVCQKNRGASHAAPAAAHAAPAKTTQDTSFSGSNSRKKQNRARAFEQQHTYRKANTVTTARAAALPAPSHITHAHKHRSAVERRRTTGAGPRTRSVPCVHPTRRYCQRRLRGTTTGLKERHVGTAAGAITVYVRVLPSSAQQRTHARLGQHRTRRTHGKVRVSWADGCAGESAWYV